MTFNGWRLPKRGLWKLEWRPFRSGLPDSPVFQYGALALLVGVALLLVPHTLWTWTWGFPVFPLLGGLKSLTNFGSAANDGTGDSPRTAAMKLSAPYSKTYVANQAQYGGATKEAIITNTISAAVTDGATAVLVPQLDTTQVPAMSMLPYNASLVTFNNSVKMLREGGSATGYQWDVHAYGAYTDGATDSYAAINAAQTAAAAANGTTLFDRYTYILSSALTATASKKNILQGAGRDVTILRRSGGGAVLNWVGTSNHPVTEFGSGLYDLSLDGNGATSGVTVTIQDYTLLRLERLFINNGATTTATSLRLVSMFDSEFDDVYVAGGGGGAGFNDVAQLDCTLTAGDSTNNCLFINFHVEPGPVDAILFNMIGNATNPLTANKFVNPKFHGDPSTSNPATHPVLQLSQYAQGNRFYGGEAAFGHGTAQIITDGQRNRWDGMEFGIGSVTPTYAIQCTSHANTEDFWSPNFKLNTYGTAYFRAEASSVHCHLLFPQLNSGGTLTVVSDAGRSVALYDDLNSNTGTIFYAADNYQIQGSIWDRRFDLTWGASVTVPNFQSRKLWLTATSNIAATLSTPNSAPASGQSSRMSITFRNNSGGALSTPIAFSAGYKTSGTVSPANGTQITVDFDYDQVQALWIEASRGAQV